jgi:hypothetical protein
MEHREAKVRKLRYDKVCKAYEYLAADEVRIGCGNFSYLSVGEDGVTIAGGVPSRINLNTLSPIYASFVRDTPFPLSLLPSMLAPPKQLPAIPLGPYLPVIARTAALCSAFVL